MIGSTVNRVKKEAWSQEGCQKIDIEPMDLFKGAMYLLK